MTIKEIYTQYKIMPTLQLHMLRVAAVAELICTNMEVEVNSKNVISACLLHDMGNIIKFKLGFIPQAVEPEGLEYWQNVKDEFIKKYGDEEHQATYAIAEELGVSDRVMELIKAIGFSKSLKNSEHNDFEKKIACYCDHRVGPEGVLSLEERMENGQKRFKANKDVSTEDNQKYLEEFNNYSDGMRKLEKQIFENCRIKPEDIRDESVAERIEKLSTSSLSHKVTIHFKM